MTATEIDGMAEQSSSEIDPSTVKKLGSRDVPLSLLDNFHAYSVGLIGVRQRRKPAGFGSETSIKTAEWHCASGTLVRSSDRHFILTAAHCARALAKWDHLGLVLATTPNAFTIPGSPSTFVGDWQSAEWGPDLAFVPIPPEKVAAINSFTSKRFWNLDRYQAEILKNEPKFDSGVWVLVGTPDLYSKVREPHAQELRQMAYRLGSVGWPRTHGEFDYVHVPMLGEDLPDTFQGVSGGGLWRAEIERGEDGSVTSVGDLRLEGCAFYELPLLDRYRVIRCHGRRSIYEHGLGSLR